MPPHPQTVAFSSVHCLALSYHTNKEQYVSKCLTTEDESCIASRCLGWKAGIYLPSLLFSVYFCTCKIAKWVPLPNERTGLSFLDHRAKKKKPSSQACWMVCPALQCKKIKMNNLKKVLFLPSLSFLPSTYSQSIWERINRRLFLRHHHFITTCILENATSSVHLLPSRHMIASWFLLLLLFLMAN